MRRGHHLDPRHHASGGYEREWRNVLHKAGIEVRIVDPKRVCSFAQSAGRLAKTIGSTRR